MRILVTAAAAALALSCAASASAEPSAKDALAAIAADSNNPLILYIGGNGNGLSWANAQLQATRRARLYCSPQDKAFSALDYVQILRDYVATHAKEGELPAGFTMMLALEDKFPCPAASEPKN